MKIIISEQQLQDILNDATSNNVYTLYHGSNHPELNINNKDIWLASDINYSKIWGENIFEVKIRLNKVLNTFEDIGNKKLSIKQMIKYLKHKNVYTNDIESALASHINSDEKNSFWNWVGKHRTIQYMWTALDIFNSGYDAIKLFEYGFSYRDRNATYIVHNPKEKIISITKMNNINEGSSEEVKREFLSKEFEKENQYQEENEILLKQYNAKHDIVAHLISLGFYNHNEININFEPSISDIIGTFTIPDFIKEHKLFLQSKYGEVTDNIWEENMNHNIIPVIKNSLQKYKFSLKENGVLYGNGDLLIKFDTNRGDNLKYSQMYPQMIIRNPGKMISPREFSGIEDRTEKRKFFKYMVDDMNYKFLFNPLKQDMIFGSGNKGILGNLFGGLLGTFLDISPDLSFDKCILQIFYDYNIYNFVIGGNNDFYLLDDAKKFMENHDHPIKKINNTNQYYNILLDLKSIYEKLKDKNPKMIVFIKHAHNFRYSSNHMGTKDRKGIIYYPYVLF